MDWKNIFMNISIDSVLIDTWDKYRINIPRDNVEKLLWEELVKLHREIWFENVVVLNWPWGFTNLRVGTLCLNVLNTLLKNQLSFYNISKIDLYKKAYKKCILPGYWVIYIGQKRNIWLRNFEKNEKIWQYSFNELEDLEEMRKVENVFVEDIEEQEYYPDRMNKYVKYHIVYDWNIALIDWKNYNKNQVSIEEFGLEPLKSIAPNYMMEPSVTISNK